MIQRHFKPHRTISDHIKAIRGRQPGDAYGAPAAALRCVPAFYGVQPCSVGPRRAMLAAP
jgi:hypothetical protein